MNLSQLTVILLLRIDCSENDQHILLNKFLGRPNMSLKIETITFSINLTLLSAALKYYIESHIS